MLRPFPARRSLSEESYLVFRPVMRKFDLNNVPEGISTGRLTAAGLILRTSP
jgi:hypothetical protein